VTTSLSLLVLPRPRLRTRRFADIGVRPGQSRP